MDDGIDAELVKMGEAEWRATVTAALLKGRLRMDDFEQRIKDNTDAIVENTTLTKEVKRDTEEFLEVFKAMKGGFKVLEWLGKIGKVLGGIAAGIGGLYGLFQLVKQMFAK